MALKLIVKFDHFQFPIYGNVLVVYHMSSAFPDTIEDGTQFANINFDASTAEVDRYSLIVYLMKCATVNHGCCDVKGRNQILSRLNSKSVSS